MVTAVYRAAGRKVNAEQRGIVLLSLSRYTRHIMLKSSQSAESTTFNGTSLPTHDQLVSLIQFELDRAEKMAAKPGWTTWALWGALATVAWLVGREVKGSPIAWDAVESWFLFGSIFTDLILIISESLNHESNKQNHGHRFFIPNRSLGSARSVLVLLLLRYGILTVMGVHQFSLLSPWYAYPLVSYTILASVFFATLLVLSFVSYPLPSTQASTWPKNIIFGLLVLLVVI